MLVEETIRTHRDVADAIASRNPTAVHDAMYLHLVYNRNMIAEGAEAKGILGPTIIFLWQNAGSGCPTHRAAAAFCNRLVQRG